MVRPRPAARPVRRDDRELPVEGDDECLAALGDRHLDSPRVGRRHGRPVVAHAPVQSPVGRRLDVDAVVAVERDDRRLVEYGQTDRRAQAVMTLETRVLDPEVGVETAVLALNDVRPHLTAALRTDTVPREAVQVPDPLVERRERLGVVTTDQPPWWERVLAVRAATRGTLDRERFVAVRRDQRTATPGAVVAGVYRVEVGMCVERALDGCPDDALPGCPEFVSVVHLANEVSRQLAQMVVELGGVVRPGSLVERREPDRLLVGVPEGLQDRHANLVADHGKRLGRLETVVRLPGEFHRLQPVHARLCVQMC